MANSPIRVELTNDLENFEKLIQLVNYYNKTLEQYQKVLQVIETAPRHNGVIHIDERCLVIIKDTLADYDVVTAYTQKVMSKESTLH